LSITRGQHCSGLGGVCTSSLSALSIVIFSVCYVDSVGCGLLGLSLRRTALILRCQSYGQVSAPGVIRCQDTRSQTLRLATGEAGAGLRWRYPHRRDHAKRFACRRHISITPTTTTTQTTDDVTVTSLWRQRAKPRPQKLYCTSCTAKDYTNECLMSDLNEPLSP